MYVCTTYDAEVDKSQPYGLSVRCRCWLKIYNKGLGASVSHYIDKICQVIREEFHSLIIQMAQKTEATTFDDSHLENT